MNNLIKISYNEADEPVVSGRDLHETLEVDSNYTTWFNRMCEYGFEAEKDYLPILENRSDGLAGRQRTDHIITLDMAKQLCMIQRTDIGRKCREYFIEVEKAWNSDEMIKSRALKIFERDNKALTAENNRLLTSNNRLLADNTAKDERITELEDQLTAAVEDNDKLSKRVMENGIKAWFADRVIDSGENMCIRETAKELGVKESDFTSMLVERKYLYRNKSHQGRLLPYSSPQCRGVFVVKEVQFKGGMTYQSQTLITPAGRIKLHAECIKAGLINEMPVQDSILWEFAEARA